MEDELRIEFVCGNWQELLTEINRVTQLLSAENKTKLVMIVRDYAAEFGPDGMFSHFENKTVGDVLAEYSKRPAKPVVKGQQDGKEYFLFDSET